MNITAGQFSNQPELAYRSADKGEDVIINHDRYKDVIFVLTARERGEAMAKDHAEIVESDS